MYWFFWGNGSVFRTIHIRHVPKLFKATGSWLCMGIRQRFVCCFYPIIVLAGNGRKSFSISIALLTFVS